MSQVPGTEFPLWALVSPGCPGGIRASLVSPELPATPVPHPLPCHSGTLRSQGPHPPYPAGRLRRADREHPGSQVMSKPDVQDIQSLDFTLNLLTLTLQMIVWP